MTFLRLKCVLAFLVLSFLYNPIFAQTGTGKITAVVKEAESGETIPFASAILINKSDNATVRVAQADINGKLEMKDLPFGTFIFKVSYIGYQTMVRADLRLSANAASVNLGDINLKPSAANALNEVVVEAKRPAMLMGIDKKVFAVDQSLVSEGGSATDLLQNVPSVQVDMDGNVSLRGSSGVRVLIDGKPSLIAGGNVSQILQSIPAGSIESVEVITNPSSKYDAEGQAGIINIVLKRNNKLGFNGNVSGSVGNQNNYNANTGLSFQNSKINIYGNYGYRNGNRSGGGFNDITYLNPLSNLVYANQFTDSRGNNSGHNLKGGIDYYLTEKSIISLNGGYNSRNMERNELLDIQQLGANLNPLNLSNRKNENNGGGSSYDLNLDFTQKFAKPKEELSFSASYSNGNNDNMQSYNTMVYNQNGTPVNIEKSLQRTLSDGKNKNYNIQLDYVLPIGKEGRFETGFRSQIRKGDNNQMADSLLLNQNYDINYELSNNFESKDQVHAVYTNYQNQIGNFGYQLGLRLEDAALDTRLMAYDLNTHQPYRTDGRIAYTRLYPSVYLTQKLKNEQQLQLSYTRRVNRPRQWDTNPFMDVSDPLNYRAGNPNLKPEDVHSFELGYSKYFKKVTLTSSLYLRQTNDVIQRIRTEPDINGIVINIPQNLTRSINSGLELIARVDLAKAYNFTANVNLYQSNIKGVPSFGIVESSGFSWNANLTNNFTILKNFTAQLRADYRAKEVMAQGVRNAMFGLDGGLRYDFLENTASLSLNIRDMLNSRKWSMTTNGNSTFSESERRMQGTMGTMTLSYRFGKSLFKAAKKPKREEMQSPPDEGQF